MRYLCIYIFVSVSLLLTVAVGCENKQRGPKLADHEAAHTPRYHPDVRRDRTRVPQSAPATQPAEIDPEKDLNFSGPIGCPVLFVNGDNLTVQEVLEPILDDLKQQVKLMTPTQYRYYLVEEISKQVDAQTSRLVVYQEAMKEFPEKAQAAIEKEAERWMQRDINNRFGGVHARYEAHLKDLGLTVDDRKEAFKREVTVLHFLQERFRPMIDEPPRREIVKYYENHMDEFTTEAEAEMFLIEIPLAKALGKPLGSATPAEIDAARSEARQTLQRAHDELVAGFPFEEVAKAYSQGLRASTGGAWGTVKPDTLTGRWAEVSKVLFTLEPDTFSEVRESDESLFIVKSGQMTAAKTLSFEEAQGRIMNRLKDEQYARLTNAYISRILQKATISMIQRREFVFACLAAAPLPAEITGRQSPTVTN